MSYSMAGRTAMAGVLDEVKINPDGTISVPSFGLSRIDLTDPKQLLNAQDAVDRVVRAMPIDLQSIAGGSGAATSAWQAQAVGIAQAIASGNGSAALKAGVALALTAGGTAACVATGAGAAVAPLCGTVAGMLTPIAMKVGEGVAEGIGTMFGMKSSAEKERERLQASASRAADDFVAAKERALVGLAKLEQALADQTLAAAAAAFAKVRGIVPQASADQILAKMVRDAGGALNPDAPMDPETGFSARTVAAQAAGKALVDQVKKSGKAGAEFFLRAFATIGPVIAKRYQYEGPVPRDPRAPNQVDFVAWWSNMPSDVWWAGTMTKGFPLVVNPSNGTPCRMRSFAADDPANGWAGATFGTAYNYAYPDLLPGTNWDWLNKPGRDSDEISVDIQRWNIKAWNTWPAAGGSGWTKFNNPDYVAARLGEMWKKRVECVISAHVSAYRSALQFQLGELMKGLMADEMRLRLSEIAAAQKAKKAAKGVAVPRVLPKVVPRVLPKVVPGVVPKKSSGGGPTAREGAAPGTPGSGGPLVWALAVAGVGAVGWFVMRASKRASVSSVSSHG